MFRQELNTIKLSKNFYSWRWYLFVFLLYIASIKLETHRCHFVTFSNVIPYMLSGTCCRKVIRAYQDSWDHRCRLLFCCMRNSDRNRVSKKWHTNVIQSFISPNNAQLICFKILKFTLKCTINAPTWFGLTKPSSGSPQSVLR
jgi:hypothetical protein